MTKQKFKIAGMHCMSCAMNIDGELEDANGVKSSSTNYARQYTEVEYDPSKVDEKKIVRIIKDAGYDAQIG